VYGGFAAPRVEHIVETGKVVMRRLTVDHLKRHGGSSVSARQSSRQAATE
jgi:hypothetical protein